MEWLPYLTSPKTSAAPNLAVSALTGIPAAPLMGARAPLAPLRLLAKLSVRCSQSRTRKLMPKRPVEHEKEASTFYADLNKDVTYFAAIWHTFKVGHLLVTDLDRICRRYGLSMADIHLMGALRLDETGGLRATDLAQTLHVSNAVLSPRVVKLERLGMIERQPSAADSRSFQLRIKPSGIAALDAVIEDINLRAHFVRCYRKLPQQDRDALARIMGEMHNQLDREFVSTSRGDG